MEMASMIYSIYLVTTTIKDQGINGLSFEIYNRWGQIVFQTEDLKEGWNGNI